ncbi:hydantoinase/oxoprolinase family protein [Acuticoccus sp. M5D2P5]|uniref:hydantoinase/oxoprolinase family protein n=1 Tax=Acuticoccus kalidii TaxID=2910977 RepID=UPI001F186A14|nr:hydantoinase/oxoprolinase family protein [Acuticoccus kalidii]MCF3935788.1 hydantoinase/oxoprolinase family protein [Acuticoccus kalidii]
MLRLGIDIGGTFTDFALIDGSARRTVIHKRLTTPDDPARAVLEGVASIADEAGIAVGAIEEIIHGTTLVTNALIERRGAKVGMLVTEGFRDTFDIGQEQRYDLYDMRLRFAEPLVPRRHRVEIAERITHTGAVLTPLDEAAVRSALAYLVETEGCEAIAVCYLHAYRSATHEEATEAIARSLYPEIPVSTSSGVFPYAREFERWTTTCANAYAQPMVDTYLARLTDGLAEIGFAGRLAIIGSGGGLMSPETARQHPVRLLESGPAAGVLMAARLGEAHRIDNLLSFDLGGTTAKGALVRGGKPFKTYSFEAAHAYKHKSGSGLKLQIPVIDMAEIGSGGGSIVRIDQLGLMRVGPESAGAMPGPVAYGRGGKEATLTDANLVLGYLDADYFLGGAMRLDAAGARNALDARGKPLGLETLRTAWGIHDIANEDISRAFRMHATERGFDYRRSGMAAFGGGGPIHAARIARKLKVPQVVFPAGAGVMSAFGMLSGAAQFEVIRSHRTAIDALTGDDFKRAFAPLEEEASAYLLSAGLAPEAISIERRLDMRYRGQGYDIEVALPPGDPAALLAALPALFDAAYGAVFEVTLDEPVEIVSLKVEASGPRPVPVPILAKATGSAEDALKGSRMAYFPTAGGLIDTPVYDRYRLTTDAEVTGPALIEERESTVLLDAGDVGTVTPSGDIVAAIAL